MDSAHLVDPELEPGLDLFPPLQFSAVSLEETRARFNSAALSNVPPDPMAVETVVRHIAGPPGAPTLRIVVYQPMPLGRDMPALLHIHGGGYLVGVPEMNAQANQELASLGCLVVSVDYRVPPETPHPGPIEDCYAALIWLHANCKELGVDSRRIGIGGESAGGGLAAALALMARDRGKVPLRFQHLVYPMLDDRTCTKPEKHPYAGQFVWTLSDNFFGWSSLLGNEPGLPGVSCYAAAARAEDLSKLPPAFIAVGALDLFLEEDMDYARRLARDGVPVELHVYPGAYHGFQIATAARTSVNAKLHSLTALRHALGF